MAIPGIRELAAETQLGVTGLSMKSFDNFKILVIIVKNQYLTYTFCSGSFVTGIP